MYVVGGDGDNDGGGVCGGGSFVLAVSIDRGLCCQSGQPSQAATGGLRCSVDRVP